VTGVLYNDLAGNFPFMSLDGSVCFFVMFHYETNAILAARIANLAPLLYIAADCLPSPNSVGPPAPLSATVFPAIIDRCRHRPMQSSTAAAIVFSAAASVDRWRRRCTSSYFEVYSVYIGAPPHTEQSWMAQNLRQEQRKRDPEDMVQSNGSTTIVVLVL
jgi:hypothetical protein